MLEDGHVATDLTQAAQGDDPQPSLGKRRGGFKFGVWMTHTLTLPGVRDGMIQHPCDLCSDEAPGARPG